MKIAIVSLVKNPAQRPVKTRLANSIGGKFGRQKAERIYRGMVSGTREVLEEVSQAHNEVQCFFAVDCDPAISIVQSISCEGLTSKPDKVRGTFSFEELLSPKIKTFSQSDGSLGERLFAIQQTLCEYDAIIYLGSDLPQLNVELLDRAQLGLQTYDYVVGPATDGGFYLLGSKRPLSRDEWLQIRYSHRETLADLRLQFNGPYLELECLTDVDDVDSLKQIFADSKQSQIQNPSFLKEMEGLL